MNLVLALILGSILILWLYGHFIYYKIDNHNDRGSWVGFALFLFLLFGSIFTWNVYFEGRERISEEHYFYMHSLGNDKYMEGDFTLGSGNIDEIDYYFFYGRTIRGMTRIKIPVRNAYLIEKDIDRPKVMKVLKSIDDEDLFFKNLAEPNSDYDPLYYKMYVPKGTIVKEFKVR